MQLDIFSGFFTPAVYHFFKFVVVDGDCETTIEYGRQQFRYHIALNAALQISQRIILRFCDECRKRLTKHRTVSMFDTNQNLELRLREYKKMYGTYENSSEIDRRHVSDR